jgi:4-hydroxy-tetrahydrodipicolinate synthase
MREIGHLLTPLVTPFRANGDIDYNKCAELARWVVKKQRPTSVIVSGTTGEFTSLTVDERVKLFEVVADAVRKDVPVIAGTGCASTRETVRLTRQAEKIGVDMAMVVAPFYMKTEQAGLLAHYKAVAKATALPILLYNIPLFTGVNIEPDTLVKLTAIDNIFGVKEESGLNPLQSTRFLMRTPKGFRLYVGDDTMVLPILVQGGDGAVSGGAQVCGKDMSTLIEAIRRGDVATAQKLHRKTFPFFEALYQNGRINPIPILRAAIGMAGMDVGKARSPLYPATATEVKVMRQVMEERGYLG